MIVVCAACQARYKFDESKLGNRAKARTKCAKCGAGIEIENPMFGDMTLPPDISVIVEESEAPTPPRREPSPAEHESPPEHDSEVLSTRKAIPVQEEAPGSRTISGGDAHRMGLLELPENRRFSVAIIQGAGTGQIHLITKTRTLIGRTGADINVDDPECSRQHCALEILGDMAMLRDLGSTNGTFIDFDRIEQQALQNHMEFRIGSHVLMFIVTELD